MKYQKWVDKNIDNLKGKVIIVTGASSGIGKYSSLYFAYKGATVIMACRNIEKAEKVKQELLSEVPDGNFDIIIVNTCAVTLYGFS